MKEEKPNVSVWTRVQWGGGSDGDFYPTYVGTYTGVLNSALKPRWVRSALYIEGQEPTYTEWVEVPDQ